MSQIPSFNPLKSKFVIVLMMYWDITERECLILQRFRRLTYVIAHFTTFLLLHLRHLASRPWALIITYRDESVTQVVGCSPTTAGSEFAFRLHVWVSWRTKRSLGRVEVRLSSSQGHNAKWICLFCGGIAGISHGLFPSCYFLHLISY